VRRLEETTAVDHKRLKPFLWKPFASRVTRCVMRPVGRGLRTRRATMNSSAGTPTLQEHVAAPSPAPKRPGTSRPAFTAYKSPGYSRHTPANARIQGLGVLSPSLSCEICQRLSPLRFRLWFKCISPVKTLSDGRSRWSTSRFSG
jgi:hypothetical protein